jgi:hypothetical protein
VCEYQVHTKEEFSGDNPSERGHFAKQNQLSQSPFDLIHLYMIPVAASLRVNHNILRDKSERSLRASASSALTTALYRRRRWDWAFGGGYGNNNLR